MPLIGRIASAAARGYGLFANIVQAVVVDPYFNYVVALLHGDGTNGGQNNTFLDSSTNNFTITRNGNTTQGSFSPFSQTGWSNYFDGTSDYLSITNNANLYFGTSQFCIEAWVYRTTAGNAYDAIASMYSGGNNGWLFSLDSTGAFLTLIINPASGPVVTGSTRINVGSWYHCVGTRDSSNRLRLFVNGNLESNAVDSTNCTDTAAMLIGAHQGFSRDWDGYISNLRIVKGSIPTNYQTASTTNGQQIFTPPTTPLTAITNTQLLTCQSNRFIDNSTNAFAITKVGDTSVQPFSPFNPTTAYSASSIAGSGYFDGSGDYLNTPSTGQFAPTGDFTIGVWYYPTSTRTFQQIIGNFNGSASTVWIFEITNGTGINFYTDGSAYVRISGSGLFINAWNYLALVRSGSTITGYVNGVSIGTYSQSGTFGSATQAISIGRGGSSTSAGDYGLGYISDVKLIDGSAVTTIPTAPQTNTTGTKLLLSFTNGAIFDNAAVADYETVGNAQISTSVKKYGTGSMYFDGTGDWLVAPASTSWDFGSGDFTVELWVNPSATTAVEALVSKGNASSTGNEVWTLQWYGTNQLAFFSGGGLGAPVVTTGSVFATGNWYHVAVCRTAGVTKIFVNGTEQGTSTTSYTITAGGALYVGAGWYAPASRDISGYIDDLRITKGVARYPYSFTPPTAALPDIGGPFPTLTADPYYEYTTLLLPGNGTNGAQNNTFLDSSTNAFTITRNGNTTQGTFSPFSQTGWSNNFDGSGDYLTFTGSSALTATGDFTFECWIYVRTIAQTGASNPRILTSPNGLTLVLVASTNNLRVDNDGVGASPISTANDSIIFNQWMHVAVVRSGSTLTAYLNGTSAGSATHTSTFTETGSIGIGYTSAGPGGYFNGYISNMRMVVGTAVYTANFTPPTAALTAITNTQLLTCQSNRFVDNSSNAFALTRAGDTSIQAFSPFNPTASWSAATYGGSGYFDGSGDYLSIPNSTSLQLGSSDWDIECWIYLNSTSGIQRPISQADSNYEFAFYISSGALTAYSFQSGGTQNFAISMGTLTSGQWYHIAATRSGSNIRAFVNGAQVGTATFSGTIDARTGGWRVGASYTTSEYLNGYVTDARIVKGSAVYTAAFTPPTAPLTAITNTSLLLNYTNAGIYDATSKNDLETVGNAQISTTQSKFGGSSMYFDGTGDGLTQPAVQNLNWSFGSGDMTIECWAYFNSVSGYQTLVDFRPSGGGFGTSSFVLWVDAGTLSFFAGAYSGASPVLSGGSISTGQWYHIVISRYGGTTKLFLNGNQTATTTNAWAQTFSATDILSIGATTNVTGNYLNGYINDLRITKGIARYTSNFTPPTTAFLTL